MLYLKSISIEHLRNLETLHLNEFNSGFNVLYGHNGSGKTSFLESLYLISYGRSFRSHLTQPLIQHEAKSCQIFARIQHNHELLAIGLEKNRTGTMQLKLNQENIPSHSAICRHIPLRFIGPDSHCLLSAGPKYRRQFLDWGLFYMFHVEQNATPSDTALVSSTPSPSALEMYAAHHTTQVSNRLSLTPIELYLKKWRSWQRALKQRNAALRAQASTKEVRLWDAEIIESAEWIDALRREYLAQLEPLLEPLISELLGLKGLSLSYSPGWNSELSLADAMAHSLTRDQQVGYTTKGPQRADLLIRYRKRNASETLSQGQQKCVVYALSLAQGQLLYTARGRNCLYLIDDLPAELDNQRRNRVATALRTLNAQVFITGAERSELEAVVNGGNYKMFHVEQGKIKCAE